MRMCETKGKWVRLKTVRGVEKRRGEGGLAPAEKVQRWRKEVRAYDMHVQNRNRVDKVCKYRGGEGEPGREKRRAGSPRSGEKPLLALCGRGSHP